MNIRSDPATNANLAAVRREKIKRMLLLYRYSAYLPMGGAGTGGRGGACGVEGFVLGLILV
jgi:hypothetical protein